MPEKRRTPRAPRDLAARMAIIGRERTRKARVANISKDGFEVRFGIQIAPGTPVRIEIIEEESGVSRKHLTRVVWSRASMKGKGYDIGLRMIEWEEIARNRRRHPREPANRFIQYRDLAIEPPHPPRPAMLLDISRGGLSFAITVPCTGGALLEVQIPAWDSRPARTVRARIVDFGTYGSRERWLVRAEIVS